MTKLYKLTDENGRTYGGTQWGEGVTHEGTGEGELCGPGWIHAYTHPLLAVLLNPVHAYFKRPQLWECEGEIVKDDHGLKVGCKRLTTIRRIKLPTVSAVQTQAFAILAAKEVCRDEKWNAWADRWLCGDDRSEAAAAAADATWTAWAARAAVAAAWAARAAAQAAVWAARAGAINLIAIAEKAVAEF